MNTNKVADAMLDKLSLIHTRVYRNEPPNNPTFPYVVFDCETINDSYPSDDYYIYVNVFESPNESVRVMNDIADQIDGLNDSVVDTADLNMHITKISRQFVSNSALTTSKAINLQYAARVYFK